MPIQRVTGPDDARIAEYTSVPDPELVRRRGLFVAEGRLVVRRLLEDRRYHVRSVLLSDAALRSLEPLVAHAGAPIYVCNADDFHVTKTAVINPEVGVEAGQFVLTGGYCGSSADFCQVCDTPARVIGYAGSALWLRRTLLAGRIPIRNTWATSPSAGWRWPVLITGR